MPNKGERDLEGGQVNGKSDRGAVNRKRPENVKNKPVKKNVILRSNNVTNDLPEQAQELTQGQLEGDQELCFVQQGEILFTDVALNYYLHTNTHPDGHT